MSNEKILHLDNEVYLDNVVNLENYKLNRQGTELLEVAKGFYTRLADYGSFLGINDYPSFLDEQIEELERIAFDNLGIKRDDEYAMELYHLYIFGDLTINEFLVNTYTTERGSEQW